MQPILNQQIILKKILLQNSNRSIFSHFTIYSILNKLDSLVTIVNKNIDVLRMSETKNDPSFTRAHFHIEGYTTPYRLGRAMHGSNMLLYVREKTPSSLLDSDVPIELFFVELNLRKKKWLFVDIKARHQTILKKLEET